MRVHILVLSLLSVTLAVANAQTVREAVKHPVKVSLAPAVRLDATEKPSFKLLPLKSLLQLVPQRVSKESTAIGYLPPKPVEAGADPKFSTAFDGVTFLAPFTFIHQDQQAFFRATLSVGSQLLVTGEHETLARLWSDQYRATVVIPQGFREALQKAVSAGDRKDLTLLFGNRGSRGKDSLKRIEADIEKIPTEQLSELLRSLDTGEADKILAKLVESGLLFLYFSPAEFQRVVLPEQTRQRAFVISAVAHRDGAEEAFWLREVYAQEAMPGSLQAWLADDEMPKSHERLLSALDLQPVITLERLVEGPNGLWYLTERESILNNLDYAIARASDSFAISVLLGNILSFKEFGWFRQALGYTALRDRYYRYALQPVQEYVDKYCPVTAGSECDFDRYRRSKENLSENGAFCRQLAQFAYDWLLNPPFVLEEPKKLEQGLANYYGSLVDIIIGGSDVSTLSDRLATIFELTGGDPNIKMSTGRWADWLCIDPAPAQQFLLSHLGDATLVHRMLDSFSLGGLLQTQPELVVELLRSPLVPRSCLADFKPDPEAHPRMHYRDASGPITLLAVAAAVYEDDGLTADDLFTLLETQGYTIPPELDREAFYKNLGEAADRHLSGY